jgi:hypothetical protein
MFRVFVLSAEPFRYRRKTFYGFDKALFHGSKPLFHNFSLSLRLAAQYYEYLK